MSFKANPNSRDFGAVKNENAIKQAVLNLIKTDIGEKPFQYDVGSRVTGLLFEPYDVFTGEAIKDEIFKNTIIKIRTYLLFHIIIKYKYKWV